MLSRCGELRVGPRGERLQIAERCDLVHALVADERRPERLLPLTRLALVGAFGVGHLVPDDRRERVAVERPPLNRAPKQRALPDEVDEPDFP